MFILVGKVAVPGTPWCIVWTGDGKHFFFNPSARLSLWDIPEDLRHRPDLQKLIDDGPAQPEDQEKPISKPNPILDDVCKCHFMPLILLVFS